MFHFAEKYAHKYKRRGQNTKAEFILECKRFFYALSHAHFCFLR